ncbi:nedd8-activating enzyme e1 regulatory subunit [Phtheirospermum japonicum]|uniref:Nedd8-activating enzyme e1 regulatory subunit n=1 Tax=Phtheirospermum japonicum TaxID=374723 RepID=A0A830BA30_9LAMI|nr:nedd8-activating enzyme e1 regulatory subunit [Phtheirospermum japonicum]
MSVIARPDEGPSREADERVERYSILFLRCSIILDASVMNRQSSPSDGEIRAILGIANEEIYPSNEMNKNDGSRIGHIQKQEMGTGKESWGHMARSGLCNSFYTIYCNRPIVKCIQIKNLHKVYTSKKARYRPVEDEYNSPAQLELQKYLSDEDYSIAIGFYILLRAVDRFAANYNSFPGQFDG